jgi:hypothetical protein|tara:strand:- start:2929 stop:5058 length:2130 start_codon:yes stop_codon:yes gene_type:complete
MATTPLIRTPQADGGTFYTFSSAAKDLSRTLNNDGLKLVFSKFVLLNLPDFDKLESNPNNPFGNKENYMQFDTIDGAIWNGGLKGDPNVNFTESLQNYALNIEELIISDPTYDNTTNLSVTERVFFKWLKECGALRFRAASELEKSGTAEGLRFVEEDEATTGTRQYRRVVKYIGEIDIVNNVDRAGEAYTELYINVPTEVGGTPTILFDSVSDANYQPSLTIQGSSEFILGRNSATIHPQGLSISAFYDYDNQLQGLGPAGYTDPDADWMGLGPGVTSAITNAYFTEPSSFESVLNAEIIKYKGDYNNPTGYIGSAYLRSELDGISVDFNPNDYEQIVADNTVSTIPQFNGTGLSQSFEFNAVLVYYDMVDLSDSTKTTTNLYGLLLLDNVTPTTDGGYIQRYPKYKPNLVTGQNGNSYGFKINLRFDASPGSAGIDTIINDYNTFSMGLFSDASAQLQTSAQIFQRQQLEIADIEVRLAAVENTLNAVSTSAFLQSQIDSLQSQIDNASLAFASSTTLLDLIAKNSDEIQMLANGQVSTTLQYNTAVVRQGSGITVDTNTPNQIHVSNNVQAYNFMLPFDNSDVQITTAAPLNINVVAPQVFTTLGTYSNMLRLDTINQAGGDLDIFIDDTTITWKTGQTVRLTFNNILQIGSRDIRIFTDAPSRLNSGAFGKIAATIPNASLSDIPIIDLICTEQGVLTFVYDIVK